MSMRDGTQETFETDTAGGLTIVDFWAQWCGPCRSFAPKLEKACEDAGLPLVKYNVDDNRSLAGRLNVSTIPAVFAYRNGEQVGSFVGGQDESWLMSFLASL